MTICGDLDLTPGRDTRQGRADGAQVISKAKPRRYDRGFRYPAPEDKARRMRIVLKDQQGDRTMQLDIATFPLKLQRTSQ